MCHASEERHQLCLLAVIEQIMAMIAVDTLARLSLDLFTLLVKVLTLSASPTVQQQVSTGGNIAVTCTSEMYMFV